MPLNLILTLLVTIQVWMNGMRTVLERKIELPVWGRAKRRFVLLRGPERLEKREAPATDLWIGPAGGLWSVAANWSGQVPQAGDTVQFGAAQVVLTGH